MAKTYYSTLYTAQNYRSESSSGEGFVSIAGKVVVPSGTSIATGDILKLFWVPAGATLLRLAIANNVWGTTCPIDILGDATDPNAIADTDIDFTAAHGVTTVPLQYVNDFSTTGGLTSFAADMPPRTAAECVTAVFGTVSGAVSSGIKYLTFAAELFIPTSESVVTDNTVYTWNGEASGAGVAST